MRRVTLTLLKAVEMRTGLAVDALRHLRGADAERWSDLFLHHYGEYLAGSEAPDERFKDFRNHVLHVAEGQWGGAPQEA